MPWSREVQGASARARVPGLDSPALRAPRHPFLAFLYCIIKLFGPGRAAKRCSLRHSARLAQACSGHALRPAARGTPPQSRDRRASSIRDRRSCAGGSQRSYAGLEESRAGRGGRTGGHCAPGTCLALLRCAAGVREVCFDSAHVCEMPHFRLLHPRPLLLLGSDAPWGWLKRARRSGARCQGTRAAASSHRQQPLPPSPRRSHAPLPCTLQPCQQQLQSSPGASCGEQTQKPMPQPWPATAAAA